MMMEDWSDTSSGLGIPKIASKSEAGRGRIPLQVPGVTWPCLDFISSHTACGAL